MKVRTSDGGQNSDLLSYVPIQNPRPQTPPRHNRIDAMFKINFLSIATHTVYDLICTVRRILASSGDLNPSTHLISLLVNLKLLSYVPIQNPRPQTPPRHNRIDAMFKINFLSIATHTVYDLICTVRRILASSGDLNPSTHLISLLANLKTVTLRLTWGLKLKHLSNKSLVMIGRPNRCYIK